MDGTFMLLRFNLRETIRQQAGSHNGRFLWCRALKPGMTDTHMRRRFGLTRPEGNHLRDGVVMQNMDNTKCMFVRLDKLTWKK
jgi:hypothetical protein